MADDKPSTVVAIFVVEIDNRSGSDESPSSLCGNSLPLEELRVECRFNDLSASLPGPVSICDDVKRKLIFLIYLCTTLHDYEPEYTAPHT